MAILADWPRSAVPGLHRRDLDQDQHGSAAGLGAEGQAAARPGSTRPLAHADLPRRAALGSARGALRLRRPDQRPVLPRLCRAAARHRSEARRYRRHGYVWTPPLVQEEFFEERGAWSGADMCPASVAAVTCRGPVWEFADRVQFNLARTRRVSMIWFSRSRLVDRCAILSVRPSHTLAVRSGDGRHAAKGSKPRCRTAIGRL
jgi:hypothetical protein